MKKHRNFLGEPIIDSKRMIVLIESVSRIVVLIWGKDCCESNDLNSINTDPNRGA